MFQRGAMRDLLLARCGLLSTFFLFSFCIGVQGDIRTGLYVPCEVRHLSVPAHTLTKDSHDTGNFMHYSFSNRVWVL